MAQLGTDAVPDARAASRSCGACSLCCTVLRVDELKKAASCDCVHQRGEAGCAIYASRPQICRGYRCLWLQGRLEENERPDQTGGIVDLETQGTGVVLRIQEVVPGAFEQSPALQAIAARYREQMPVRVCDNAELTNPDRPFRVLMPGGVEYRAEGDWVESWKDGVLVERKRQPWAERLARRIGIWWRGRALARIEGLR